MFMALRAAKWSRLFAQAGGAVGVDASPVDLALGADEGAGALGAASGEDDLFAAARVMCVFDDGDDLGDDVAAAFHLDEVADANAEAGDLVGVVQGCAGDGGATDEHGVSTATGVIFPVRPTWKSTCSSRVMAARAANL